MSDDNISNIILERLNRMEDRLSGDIAVLRSDMSVVKEAIRRLDTRLEAIENHVAGLFATSRHFSDELDELRGRIEHLEDNPPPENSPE